MYTVNQEKNSPVRLNHYGIVSGFFKKERKKYKMLMYIKYG